MKIYQLLSSLNFGDAVGNDVLALDSVLKEKGCETAIYANYIDPKIKSGTAISFEDMPILSENDVLIYHLALCTELNVWIRSQKCTKILIYHNITPPHFHMLYSKKALNNCIVGYSQTADLKDTFNMAIVPSEYNRQDLIKMGFTCPIHVVPILIAFNDYKKTADEDVIKKYDDGITNIAFVGRISPNKCQEDVIEAFSCYQKYYNSNSRLFIVGNWEGMEKYQERLALYAEKLGAKNVIFTGHIKFSSILAYYKIADLFLCQSEHEGFCVPLVEAMYFKKPIIAYDSSAIGGTLAGSGFLLKEKNPLETAGVINRILTDENLRNTIIKNQDERLSDFDNKKIAEQFWNALKSCESLKSALE